MVTLPESHRDLIARNQTVILATHGADGFPQVTATWFLADDDGTIRISLNGARQKVKNMQRDPRATLFLADPENPYRTLEIRATVTLNPDPDYTFADKVGAKYGSDLRTMDQPGESRFEVTLTPVKANTFG